MITRQELEFFKNNAPKIEIPKNSRETINRCAHMFGEIQKNEQEYSLQIDIRNLKIKSPIEQIFYTAFNTLSKVTRLDRQWDVKINDEEIWVGLYTKNQFKIGKYIVDFLISYRDDEMALAGQSKNVVVECDGHQFHEMSEFERRYEKARDRFMQKQEYKVFRYTGSDIVKNYFNIAAEVLSYLTGIEESRILGPFTLCKGL